MRSWAADGRFRVVGNRGKKNKKKTHRRTVDKSVIGEISQDRELDVAEVLSEVGPTEFERSEHEEETDRLDEVLRATATTRGNVSRRYAAAREYESVPVTPQGSLAANPTAAYSRPRGGTESLCS